MSACGGGGEALDSEIAYGDVFFDGHRTGALVRVHVPDGVRGAASPLRIGVVTGHLVCGRYLGFMMDVAVQETLSDVGGAREIRLRAAGGDRPACNDAEQLSACGEALSVVLVTDEDEVVARYATTYRCAFPLPFR